MQRPLKNVQCSIRAKIIPSSLKSAFYYCLCFCSLSHIKAEDCSKSPLESKGPFGISSPLEKVLIRRYYQEDCVWVLGHFSHVRLFANIVWWTIACQAPLSMGLPRQEYWSGLPFPSPGDLPHPGIEPTSLMSPTLVDGLFTTSATREAHHKDWRWTK